MELLPAPPVPRVKRLIDLTGAALLLIVTAPLLFWISVAVAVSSPGGVIYRQQRTGHGGRTFNLLKFRTMWRGAHAQRAAHEAQNESGGQLFKIRDDPRVTPVGRLLRLLSFDELPQLVNVVRGDMSLVGPRPLPVEDSGYTGPALARLDVLPGITGLWQVCGRSELFWEEMVRLDLHYVEHWSVRLDLKILAHTLPVVLAARGAH